MQHRMEHNSNTGKSEDRKTVEASPTYIPCPDMSAVNQDSPSCIYVCYAVREGAKFWESHHHSLPVTCRST